MSRYKSINDILKEADKHESKAKYHLELYHKEKKLAEDNHKKAIEVTYNIEPKYWDDFLKVIEDYAEEDETKDLCYDIYQKYKDKKLGLKDVKVFVIIHKEYGRYIKYNDAGFMANLHYLLNEVGL